MKLSESRCGQEVGDAQPCIENVDPGPLDNPSWHQMKPQDVNTSTDIEVDHVLEKEDPICLEASEKASKTVQIPQSQSFNTSNGMAPLQWTHKKTQDMELASLLPIGVLQMMLRREGNVLEQEIQLLQTHCWVHSEVSICTNYLRIYVNPIMTSRGNTQRSITKLRAALKSVMTKVNTCPEVWFNPHVLAELSDCQPEPADSEDESLWYIFNTLQDPCPQVEKMKDAWSQRAIEQLLSDDELVDLGLRTNLYPYQRRSAATMVQREAQPAQMLDPRLQRCQGPTGREYYYDREDAYITTDKVLYSEACGGILAETMGCGKTLISLAVICATRGHVPKIPVEYMSTPQKPDLTCFRESTGSLLNMAAAAAERHSEPWRAFFRDMKREGMHYERCIRACEAHRASYEIHPPQTRYHGRHSQSYPRPPAKRVYLCPGTLVIVPNNLLDHWQREIRTHTEGLDVLVLGQRSGKTPSADDLIRYDIVLFAKSRFEREAGEPMNNRRDKFFQLNSPLTELHWLRVIVDEGHNVAGHGSKTNMIHLLSQLHFERRWVISGTPSAGLYGVEVSLASQEVNASDTDSAADITVSALQSRRRTGNAVNNELKDLDRLRRIVVEFLDLKPWSNSRADDPADWAKYIKPIGADGQRRKTSAIRATLQGLVVRHQLNVVSQEIYIPKLYNEVVYLEPTFHDRLSINLFLFGLAVNAITSERQGPDYIFDSKNQKHLNQTINNLRQAGFWWASSEGNPQDTIEHAIKYMDKKRQDMSDDDIDQLTRGIEIARMALGSASWREFRHLHELGIYIDDFPREQRPHWSLDQNSVDEEPLLMGITQARRAQQFVTQHLKLADPTQGLAGAGIKVRHELERRDQQAAPRGAPESASSTTNFSDISPTVAAAAATPTSLHHSTKPQTNKSPKKTFTRNLFQSLPQDSPLQKTQFVATASAKLTYLLNKVLELQATEKIIIFYDNNNSAFWIAEGLELLGVEFRIYASTLKPELRNEYLKLFREAEDVRVLLMDLRQASHGLHIAQASRIFIVNPIWQPNVESQAIKRAHRIGQTRPVYVETLVLRDTLEDRMLKRRREMSEAEIQHAGKSLLDDGTMSGIIQREPFLPMGLERDTAAAFLKKPVGFFNRHRLPIPDDEGETKTLSNIEMNGSPSKGRGQWKGNMLSFSRGKEPAVTLSQPMQDTASPMAKVKRARVGFAIDPSDPDESGPPSSPDIEEAAKNASKRSLFGGSDDSPSAAEPSITKKPRVGCSC